jgi:hypothetical protein
VALKLTKERVLTVDYIGKEGLRRTLRKFWIGRCRGWRKEHRIPPSSRHGRIGRIMWRRLMGSSSCTHIVTGSRYWRITERVMRRRRGIWRISRRIISWVVWRDWRLCYIGGRHVRVLSEARCVAGLWRRLELIAFRVV